MVPKVVGFWQREDFNLSILAKQFCFTPASSYLWIFFFLEIIWNILRNLILQPTKNFIAFLLFNSPIWNFLSFFIHSSLAMRKSGLITLNSYLCMEPGVSFRSGFPRWHPGCHIHVIWSLLKICFIFFTSSFQKKSAWWRKPISIWHDLPFKKLSWLLINK